MEATKQFIEKINSIYPLKEHEVENLLSSIYTQLFPKNTFLLKQNEVSDKLYFIAKGLVRAFYFDRKNHEEITSWFVNEDGFIYSVLSFVKNTDSFEAIIAEEDTIAVCISKEKLKKLLAESNTFNSIVLHLTEYYLCIHDERVRSLRLSAEERYMSFQDQYPRLEARLKIKHLASYLGIGRSTLCQLRSKKVYF